MSGWGKVAIAGAVALGIGVITLLAGVMTSDSVGLIVFSIALSTVAPVLLLIALVGHVVTRTTPRSR